MIFDLKCYKSATWNSTNNVWTLITTEQHTKNFLGVWEPGFVTFDGLFFWVLDPSTLGGCNFLNFIPFLAIFNVPDAPVGV